MDTAPDVSRPHTPPLVLLADPDADTRELYSLALHLDRVEVAHAVDGPTALEIARRTLPDVLVTEIALEHVDGFQVATSLRHDAATAAMSIVAVTAYTRPDLIQRSAEAGFDDVLVKPVAPDALIAAVRDLLAAGPALREEARRIRRQSEQLRSTAQASRQETDSVIEQSRRLRDGIRAFLKRTQ